MEIKRTRRVFSVGLISGIQTLFYQNGVVFPYQTKFRDYRPQQYKPHREEIEYGCGSAYSIQVISNGTTTALKFLKRK